MTRWGFLFTMKDYKNLYGEGIGWHIEEEVEEAIHDIQSHYAVTPTVLIEDKVLTDKQKLLYLLMATYARKSGVCFASNSTLAKKMGCGLSTISQGVSKLKEEGWIKVDMVFKINSKEIKNRLVEFPHMTFKKPMTREEARKRLPDPMEHR